MGEGGDLEPECFRKIFIGGLHPSTTDESLRAYFEKFKGEILDCIVMKDSVSKRSRGFGFVTYDTPSAVEEIQNSRPHMLDGKTVDTKRVIPKTESSRSDSKMQVKKVFVGGFKEPATEEDLRQFFSTFGNIDKIDTFRDKDGQRKNFAFVTFTDHDPVDACVQKCYSSPDERVVIAGLKMEVKKARSQWEMQNEGRGGGRGGHGGGPRGGYGDGGRMGGGGGGYGDMGGRYGGGGYSGGGGGYNGGGGGGYSGGGRYGGGYNDGYGGGGGGGYNDGGWSQGYNSGGGGGAGYGGGMGGNYGGGGGGYGGGGYGGGYGPGGGGGGGNFGQGYGNDFGGGPMRGGNYGNARANNAPFNRMGGPR